MARRLPPEAFEHYLALGASRSYAQVAERYGLTKRSVTRRAAEEGWQQRVVEIEAKARAKSEEKLVETAKQVFERQTKLVRLVQSRALKTLQSSPEFATPAEALRALDFSLRQERELVGTVNDGDKDGEPVSQYQQRGVRPRNDRDPHPFVQLLEHLRKNGPKPSERWHFEAPRWQTLILLRVDHWHAAEGELSGRIDAMIKEVLAWLDGLAEEKLVDARNPSHICLLTGLHVDPDDTRRAEMREKVLVLADALEEHRETQGVRDDDPRDAAIGWAPENLEHDGGVTWEQAFGDGGGARCAISWVAGRLRREENPTPA